MYGHAKLMACKQRTFDGLTYLRVNFGGGAFWRPGPSQPLMLKYLQFGPQIIGFNTQVVRGVLGRVHQAS